MRLPFVIISRSLYDRHRAETRRAVEALREKPADYRVDGWKSDSKALDEVWARHSSPRSHYDNPGDGMFGQSWSCTSCLRPWPCEDARVVLRARQWGDREYGYLRVPIKGERLIPGGVEYGSGVMAVRHGLDVEESA